jgi:hypothetical protein
MGKAVILKAAGKVATRIESGEFAELDSDIAESHEHGVEGYVIDATVASLRKDKNALKRHTRDANLAGAEDQIELPGMERSALPIGIPVMRDGEEAIVPWMQAEPEEIAREIEACRREANARDARISLWEETMRRVMDQPEAAHGGQMGQIVAAIQVRELESGDA